MSSKLGQNKTDANAKVQPPLLALIHIAAAFVLTRMIPLPVVVLPILEVVGFVLAILGFLIGLGAMIAFRRARQTFKPQDSVPPLVTSGIYRLTRNPIYLGFLLMLVGLPLDAGSYWGFLLAPVMIFLFNKFVIGPEEAALTQKFGDEYRSYQSKVRRWI